jgi:hypothetical protein
MLCVRKGVFFCFFLCLVVCGGGMCVLLWSILYIFIVLYIYSSLKYIIYILYTDGGRGVGVTLNYLSRIFLSLLLSQKELIYNTVFLHGSVDRTP